MFNASGCNSQEEVDSACENFSVRQLHNEIAHTIYPNPISTSVVFEYQLTESNSVTLTVFNSFGQQIQILVNQHQQPGEHKAIWSAERLPSGIYFYRLTAGRQSASGKVVVVK
jgi:hypothetical protein